MTKKKTKVSKQKRVIQKIKQKEGESVGLTVNLPKGLHIKLMDISDNHNISINRIITQLVEDFLDE